MSTIPANPAASQPLDAPWCSLIPEEQGRVLEAGAAALGEAKVSFLLGGAMALAAYAGRWRNTKDIDLIVHAADHEAAITAIREAGSEDYYDREAYDRSWIFRGFRDDVIMDLIWQLPNHRVEIDDAWFERARPIQLRDRLYSAAPAEDLIRVKLYVLQRERCDWVDVLNILAGSCEALDWAWLAHRMGQDLPLLHGVLAIFNWMCPDRALAIPDWVRQQFSLPVPDPHAPRGLEEERVRLFDSRPWFAPHQPEDQPLER